MARRRFFVPSVSKGVAYLEGDAARHLTQVLRVEVGQIYEVSDNERLYLAQVETARKQTLMFRMLEPLPPEPELAPVSLFVSLIKFERLETVLEKATELGVTSIHLVEAERSEKGLERAAVKRIARWERIVLEAAQQSRRTTLPELHAPVKLKEAVKAEAEHRLFLDELRDGKSLLETVKAPASTALLVGPEGGWPGHERKLIIESGWASIAVAPLVLRTETACLAALSVLNTIFYTGLQS